jgi:hypothetical protein
VVTKLDEVTKLLAGGLEIVLTPVELLTNSDGKLMLLSSTISLSSASCSMMDAAIFEFCNTPELCFRTIGTFTIFFFSFLEGT